MPSIVDWDSPVFWRTLDILVARLGLVWPDSDDWKSAATLHLLEHGDEMAARFRHGAALSTYLYSVLLHHAMNWLRKERRYHRRFVTASDPFATARTLTCVDPPD